MTNKLPEAIRRELAEAERLEQQMYGQPAPQEGNTEPVPEPVEPEVVAEDPPTQVAQPVQDEDETYRRRYEVLNGKYAAEVPRLHAQLRETTTQLQAMAAEIERLRSAPQAPAAPEKDTDAETFGEDLTEAIDRRAERKAQAIVAEQTHQLVQYIKKLESQLGTVNQQVEVSAQDRFYGQLARLVPDYEAVNQDHGFLQWLGEVDPVYGVPRQVALDSAAQRMDADQVANVFNAYKTLTSKQVNSVHKQQVRQELQRQVAPSTTKSNSSAPSGVQYMTLAEYERALDPRNIYTMGREKADQLAQAAELALQEGRVR